MKLNGRDLAAFLVRPDVRLRGILVHGADDSAVALKREALVRAVAGAAGEGEMRVVRLDPATLRADPAALQDALRARGFFPGPRAVVVADAGDGLAALMGDAIAGAQADDGVLIASAGLLPARSKLRKRFEDAPDAAAVALYADPPGRGEIEAALAAVNLAATPDAVQDLVERARALDAGALPPLLAQLALYMRGAPAPLGLADIAACAPQTIDADLDAAVAAVAEGRVGAVGTEFGRLADQGVAATTLCIALGRHFRTLHAAAVAPEGAEAALGRARPPVFGPRRDAMLGQIRAWGVGRLERALSLITETDLALRSGGPLPDRALLERAALRIAMQRAGR